MRVTGPGIAGLLLLGLLPMRPAALSAAGPGDDRAARPAATRSARTGAPPKADPVRDQAPRPDAGPAADAAGGDAPRPATAGRPSVQQRIIAAAESYLGRPYVFGGRAGRPGCLRAGRRVRCRPGIDCQSLIFFAYEKVLGTPWRRFSVMPSRCVQQNQLGRPVPGLAGVLADELDRAALRKGDVLFFLLEDYNLQAAPPLWVHQQRRFGVWHTGLVHGRRAGEVRVIHAKPGAEVRIEALDHIPFDALYTVRLPARR